jgi:hypothetical protein
MEYTFNLQKQIEALNLSVRAPVKIPNTPNNAVQLLLPAFKWKTLYH